MERVADSAVASDPLSPTIDVAARDVSEPIFDPAELAVEAGIWLSGLQTFLSLADHGFADPQHSSAATRDFAREFRLTRSALLLCSRLNFRLGRAGADAEVALSPYERRRFGLLLRNSILLNEGLIKSGKLGFGEWSSWHAELGARLAASREARQLIRFAEKAGEEFLPEPLTALLGASKLTFADEAELRSILPRFAQILKWLSVVGRMLQNDEPLKLSLLIFARVREQTRELIAYIDKRLARFPDENAELFGSLDGASYTASLELKKVYSQELVGLVSVRPAPSVYARVETAFSLLNDSFQQILTEFARLMNPHVTMLDMFPGFRVKLDQSLALRGHLARVLRTVKAAEQSPEKALIETLRTELEDLITETMRYLFYKDRETIERFGEEIVAAADNKDLVPILHRFGAYLETLFGQVNMRTVLVGHPFDEQKS